MFIAGYSCFWISSNDQYAYLFELVLVLCLMQNVVGLVSTVSALVVSSEMRWFRYL